MRKNSFTLLEVLIVVSLVSVICAGVFRFFYLGAVLSSKAENISYQQTGQLLALELFARQLRNVLVVHADKMFFSESEVRIVTKNAGTVSGIGYFFDASSSGLVKDFYDPFEQEHKYNGREEMVFRAENIEFEYFIHAEEGWRWTAASGQLTDVSLRAVRIKVDSHGQTAVKLCVLPFTLKVPAYE